MTKRTYNRLNLVEDYMIRALRVMGKTVREIAQAMRRSVPTVRRCLRREDPRIVQERQNLAEFRQNFRRNGPVLPRNRRGSGGGQNRRPVSEARSKIAKRQRLLSRLAEQTVMRGGKRRPCFASADALRVQLFLKHGIKASKWTVRRDLAQMGYVNRVRKYVPTTVNRDYVNRLNFARRASLIRTPIVFSDEKIFTCNDDACRSMWVRHGQHVLDRERTRFPVRVMVWAAIGPDFLMFHILPNASQRNGREDERRLGTMDADYYRQKILPRVVAVCKARNWTFQQDGARPHTAKSTMAYLKRRGVRLLSGWPARSPDLSPIENLWSLAQIAVANRFPTTRAELVEAIREVMNEFATTRMWTVNKLVGSFTGRCIRVAAQHGRFN